MKNTWILVLAVAFIFVCIAGCQQNTNAQIAAVREEAVTSVVNIPNPNGSMTPVFIKRSGALWIGPRGETYQSYPTVEQLKPVYGLK